MRIVEEINANGVLRTQTAQLPDIQPESAIRIYSASCKATDRIPGTVVIKGPSDDALSCQVGYGVDYTRPQDRGVTHYSVEAAMTLRPSSQATVKPGLADEARVPASGPTASIEAPRIVGVLSIATELSDPDGISRWSTALGGVDGINERGDIMVPNSINPKLVELSDLLGGSLPTVGLPRAMYVSATTLTTLGFGDFAPVTTTARLLTSLEAVLGVVTLSLVFFTLGSATAPRGIATRDEVRQLLADALRNTSGPLEG